MLLKNSSWFPQMLFKGAAFATSLTFAPLPAYAALYYPSDAKSIESFYASREKLVWFSGSSPAPAANVLRSILKRAELDGLSDGEPLSGEVDRAIGSARANPNAASQADRVLSAAWIRYVQALNTLDPEFDGPAVSRPPPASAILTFTAAAPSLVNYLLSNSSMNPKYSQLRDAVWNEMQTAGSTPSPRALANLRRLRFKPPRNKYVIVDTAAAQLFMYERGELVDSMRVIVGSPATPTPLIASIMYSATINPYWNVPKDLVQRLIAPRVVAGGARYLSYHGYEVVSAFEASAVTTAPAEVDWQAVAGGRTEILVRQRPGHANSMGRLKFWFPNGSDIFFHDTPNKALFRRATRTLSNGCIRVEDAERFGKWLLETGELPTSATPDQEVPLPQPVPVYVTYVTMQTDSGQLTFIRDIYGRDSADADLTIAR